MSYVQEDALIMFLDKILVGIVAFEHLYFLYLEMFAWTKPRTRKNFGTTEEFATASKTLAANQGLYNGFLAAGLIWSIIAPADLAKPLAIFFLSCVFIAGAYGGYSVNKRVFFLQGMPALVALGLTLFV
jgi:putative membrane protein